MLILINMVELNKIYMYIIWILCNITLNFDFIDIFNLLGVILSIFSHFGVKYDVVMMDLA